MNLGDESPVTTNPASAASISDLQKKVDQATKVKEPLKPISTTPVSDPQTVKPTAVKADIDEKPQEKKKILVVDDEQDARDLFIELIETSGIYIVDGAKDGVEALEKCSQKKYDLLLLDIVMPRLDGVDTLQMIKNDPVKYGKPVVVMLTNIGGDLAVEKALEIGAAGFRLKIDTEPEQLLKTVATAVAGKPIVNSVPTSLF